MSRFISKIGNHLLIMALAAPFVWVSHAFSQEPAMSLEEIVVTARKREENLQDVGLAVSALSKTEIDQQYTRDLKGLANVAPNLIVEDTAQGPGGNAAIYIRGMGVQDVEKNYEPSVAVVIDDLFLNSPSGSLLRSIDLESVTVARGPQGTMFGRNAIGGAIIVTRSKPTGEPGLRVKAGFEECETSYLEFVGNMALSDTLALKVTGASREQEKGYYYNINLDHDEGRDDFSGYGASMLFTPSDTLELQLSYNKDEMDQDTPPLIYTAQPASRRPAGSPPHILCDAFGYCSPAIDIPQNGDRRTSGGVCYVPTSFDSSNKYTIGMLAITPKGTEQQVPCSADFSSETTILRAEYVLNDAMTFNYIYGLFETDESIISTWDQQNDMLYGTSRPAIYEQTSHELRLSYDAGGAFSLVAGLFVFESEYEIWLRSFIGFNPPTLALDVYQYTHQEAESEAIFFEADYRVTDSLKLTIGGRYTEDFKVSRQIGAQADTTGQHPEKEWSKFTPKVGVTYDISDNLMAFGTFSTGYRAGGYNGRVQDGLIQARTPYNPETVDSFEVGIKTELLDGRVRLNANVFSMDFEDKQEDMKFPNPDGPTGQASLVVNAAEATIKGLEAEIQAQVTESLYVRANLGLLDAEYDTFQAQSVVDGTVYDYSDRELRRAPDFTANIDATYSIDLAGGEAWARVGARYVDSHYTDAENSPELYNDDGTLTLDASLNYRRDDLTISVFGRNITDEDAWTMGYDVQPLWSYGAVQEPRVFGIEMMFEYN